MSYFESVKIPEGLFRICMESGCLISISFVRSLHVDDENIHFSGYGRAPGSSGRFAMVSWNERLHRYETNCNTRLVLRRISQSLRTCPVSAYLQGNAAYFLDYLLQFWPISTDQSGCHCWSAGDTVELVRHGLHGTLHGAAAIKLARIQECICPQLRR